VAAGIASSSSWLRRAVGSGSLGSSVPVSGAATWSPRHPRCALWLASAPLGDGDAPRWCATISLWRNPGEDLEIVASEHGVKPMQTNTLTCAFDMIRRLAIFQGLIRDEEAAGSNPATPTR
jgi:hypothetical protein